jgi:H+/Cl- antiporter ClcA
MNNDDFLAAKMDFISPVNFTNNDICVKLRENFTEVNVTLFKAFGCEELHAPQFTDRTLIKVFVLSVMGVISLVGNVATIWNIQKNRSSRRALRHSCSSIYTLILHLSVADILVTFFCIIGEAIWSYTVEWFADEISCKLLKFLQMFALYLSTLVLVLIGIDRWIAVKYPMKSKLLKTSRFVVSIQNYIIY